MSPSLCMAYSNYNGSNTGSNNGGEGVRVLPCNISSVEKTK